MSLHASPEWGREDRARERRRLERADRRLKWLKKILKKNEITVRMPGDNEDNWTIEFSDLYDDY